MTMGVVSIMTGDRLPRRADGLYRAAMPRPSVTAMSGMAFEVDTPHGFVLVSRPEGILA